MRVVRLPRGEEHGQARNESGKGAGLGRAPAHCRCLAQAGEGAVERVDAMAGTMARQWGITLLADASRHPDQRIAGVKDILEQFSKPAGGACPPCLLPVDVVHGRIP